MRVFFILILVLVFSSCVRNKNGQVIQNAVPTNAKVFEVKEVIQTSTYTYLKVTENLGERWVAVTKQEANNGDIYYYEEALQMNNFNSKELDRTFEVIYFINRISKTPITKNPMGGAMPAHSGKVETQKSSTITLEKADGEITVEQIFAKSAEFALKEFEIRGMVVKVNKQVMGKNWIHIQDGTSNEGSFDLTVTTQDLAEIGDEVTFKGKLTLEKNFGSGYFYDVIMEEAVLVSKKEANLQL
ncbi:MAG: hypothetical protein HN778_20915 [Prolixibacteraceae bacterium]|mgnify:CR=1 FL=1|jgi:hypothetical protein|nr:hypothetical protein [Prolixibacteraceae bacterium]MBT6999601.1 hypothetical protein [Prolixibacteraceae bacterium]MBT7397298.1 hypothetical protein [Prolixibacteraceae bacterium]